MDLIKVYDLVVQRNNQINSLYTSLGEFEELFRDILVHIGLECNEEEIYAITQRFVNLREDSLVNLLRRKHYSNDEIITKLEFVYEKVKDFWLQRHKETIELLKPHLDEFHIALLVGIHKIGEIFSNWQVQWKRHIIHTINTHLTNEYEDEALFEMLRDNQLFDKGHDGVVADRCYSVLDIDEGELVVKCYSEFFVEYVRDATQAIDDLVLQLADKNDPFKDEWISYLTKIKEALLCDDRDLLVSKWSEVDIAWMDIKSPIQMGHPLEYYEDHIRKAVALELDIRVQNPHRNSQIKQNIIAMYQKYNTHPKTLSFALDKINNTQLYISYPALFYAAEFDGLFSAQVVPNDEVASSLKGKKIFAFADKILQDSKAKPKMKLPFEVFGVAFMQRYYDLLEDEDKWHRVYDVVTIGHEFGHILWLDNDTESRMNVTGDFKNVEEFKATTGGLMAFFDNEDENIAPYILDDIIKRSVSLIAWQEVSEVLPYYIEGLIHLNALFDCEILSFDDKLSINTANYRKLKEWYKNAYLDLAYNYYIPKANPRGFLDKYIYKQQVYLPKNPVIQDFVKYYYDLYKQIGQVKL
ncbi:MAG: invasion protein CiaB [Epsilonproteobacteria bacterium]|nr:invasion protein CiaB [Campylobacterota bacterium]